MTLAEFIVRIVEALAWPGTVLIISFAFRKQLVSLVPLLRRIRAGGFEAEFDKEMENVTADEGWRLQGSELSPFLNSRRDELLRIAQINPRLAVIDAWQGIEFSLKRAVLQRFGASSPPPKVSSPVSMIRMLGSEELIDTSDVSLLHELRGLRNSVTHLPDFGLGYDSAVDYIELAIRLQEKLDELGQMRT